MEISPNSASIFVIMNLQASMTSGEIIESIFSRPSKYRYQALQSYSLTTDGKSE